MSSRQSRILANVLVIGAAISVLVLVDTGARHSRVLPETTEDHVIEVRQLKTQKDVYGLLRSMGARGIRLVHLNRRFNLVEYALPPETIRSRPFPIEPFDVRETMEQGLTSDNWLFIATRTGMIRHVTWVLPGSVFDRVAPIFAKDRSYSVGDGLIQGYSYDLYRVISRPDTIPRYTEPLVVTVDAGFFGSGISPGRVSDILREQLPRTVLLVGIDSTDEPDVTEEMRRSLSRFLESFARGSGASHGA